MEEHEENMQNNASESQKAVNIEVVEELSDVGSFMSI